MACPPASSLHDLIHSETRNSIPAETVAHVRGCSDCQRLIQQWGEIAKLERLFDHFGVASSPPLPGSKNAVASTATITFQRPVVRRIGQYELLRRIGQGGCGEVFEAVHSRLRRRVAVKLLLTKDAGDAYARQRFLREMESIGRLDDPHIVQAHDAGEVDGVLYLAMELVDGENVEAVARRCTPLPIAEACEIVRQAALGLQHAHEFGMVHRDLKPSNLLLSPTGVKIADLGMAHLHSTETEDARLTGAYIVLGTADYMAPEQAEESRHVDIRADIYSLGCTLFRLLAGRAPFAVAENDTAIKKLMAHAHDPIPNISLLRSEVTTELQSLLARLMAKNKGDRIGTPLELANALAPFCINADLKRLWSPLSKEPEEAPAGQPRLLPFSTQPPTHPSVPADTVPLSDEKRKSRSYVVVLAAGVLCLVALIAGRQQMGKDSKTVPNQNPTTLVNGPLVVEPVAPVVKSPPGLLQPPAIPPAVVNAPNQVPQLVLGAVGQNWQKQFGMAPTEVVWPGRSGLGICRFEDDLQSLVIQTRKSMRLIALGEFKQGDPELLFSVDMLPQTPEGEYGIFVGYRPDKNGNQFLAQFQAIQMRIISTTIGERTVLVRRCLAMISADTGQVAFERNHHEILAIPIHPEKLHFEIRLQEASLPSIKLNEFRCHQLGSDERNSRFLANDYQGRFGVIAKDTTVWFSNPHIERSAK
ncbi:MAG: serine/threonine protein kinase [Planctomycetaceae bacterium]